MRNLFLIFLFATFLFTKNSIAQIKILTTMSSYADIAKSIAGDSVKVEFIAYPKFNPHFIEPRPSDVLKAKKADLFIHSGLDLESWRKPLLDAAANPDIRSNGLKEIDLSKDISLIEVPHTQPSRAEGDIHIYGNPHYWIDPLNGIIIAKNIAKKLTEIDPINKDLYERNLHNFVSNVTERISYWKNIFLPIQGQELIADHNSWGYLINFAGLKMNKYLEPKSGIPPTAKHIQQIIQYVKDKRIKAIIRSTYFSDDAAQEVSKNTNAKIVLLCQNVGEIQGVDSYIKLIDYNLQQLFEAVR